MIRSQLNPKRIHILIFFLSALFSNKKDTFKPLIFSYVKLKSMWKPILNKSKPYKHKL